MGVFRHVKTILNATVTLAMVGAACVLAWKLVFPAQPPDPPIPQVVSVDGVLDGARLVNAQGRGRVAIVEFSDFECPYCGNHARDVLPEVKRSLVDSGRARYVMLHFPLLGIHPQALKAAEAAECAGRQGKFWEMHQRLFADVSGLAPEAVARHASTLQLDLPRFDQCLERSEAAEKVMADAMVGARLGVAGTPVFFLGTFREDGGIDLARRINGMAEVQTFVEEVAALTRQAGR